MAGSEQYQALVHTTVCQIAFVTTEGENRMRQLVSWCEEELTEQQLEDVNGLYLFASLPVGDFNPQELFCSQVRYMPFEDEPVPLLWSV